MSSLITEPNLSDFDGIYQQLIALHAGRSDEESQHLNARLILILMNHVGDEAVIRSAFELAAKQS